MGGPFLIVGYDILLTCLIRSTSAGIDGFQCFDLVRVNTHAIKISFFLEAENTVLLLEKTSFDYFKKVSISDFDFFYIMILNINVTL